MDNRRRPAFDHFIAASDLPGLEQAVFDGYLRGLRAAGWAEDPRLVQLGMWSSAVKYDWLAALTLAQVRDDRQHRYGGAGEIDPVFKFRAIWACPQPTTNPGHACVRESRGVRGRLYTLDS
jgi:hypothetical protein